jgi:uncharacterized integral membrane protein
MNKLVWGIVVAGLAMVFAIQNSVPVSVHVFSTFVIGLLTGLILLAPRLMTKKAAKTSSSEK